MAKFERPPRMTHAVYMALLDVSEGMVPAQAARKHHIHPGAIYLAVKRHNLPHIVPPSLRKKCLALRREGKIQAEIARELGKTRAEVSRALKDIPLKRLNVDSVVMPDFDD